MSGGAGGISVGVNSATSMTGGASTVSEAGFSGGSFSVGTGGLVGFRVKWDKPATLAVLAVLAALAVLLVLRGPHVGN